MARHRAYYRAQFRIKHDGIHYSFHDTLESALAMADRCDAEFFRDSVILDVTINKMGVTESDKTCVFFRKYHDLTS